jgi:hypothetical protein
LQQLTKPSLDNVTITSQLAKWEAAANKREEAKKRKNNGKVMVGTGRFELPTPRTPSECSTRLSHVPTGRKSTAPEWARRLGLTPKFYNTRRGCAGKWRKIQNTE